MADNTTLPGTGEVIEDIDIGAGVKRQVVAISGASGTDRVPVKAASTPPVATDPALVVAISPNSPLGGKGLANKCFAAAFTTLTRPANTTAYAAGDSISNSATAGSVTALSASVSDVNDDPVFLADILISSTDTGLAGKKLRANLFNADPTASSGVSGGDNAAYAQKKNGYIGTFVGTMETGFSDGSVGRLVPSFRDANYTPAGGFVVTKPVSGNVTLYIQFVAEEAFTPSANSTTIGGTVRGWQARAG